ncbi:MAG TPA: phenylalanine--tRNA ligase subunit beta [Aeromicrobium sp.]|nr:phenylalanine--tRNA ligase subunit beta [Aeromicrobium sp.]
MRVPVSWLREFAALPADLSTAELAERLTAFDLKLEEIVSSGVSGPLTVGRILTVEDEPQKNGKTVHWCTVDVGSAQEPRGIVCGAHNFGPGDLVVAALPGTTLPGGFEIGARKTYGHVSDGMICSAAELGLTGDGEGIIVLPAESARPGDDAIALLGLGEDVLDLEVNPDRAYALSIRGVARDAALATGSQFSDPADVEPIFGDGPGAYPVQVLDREACPVFAAATVTGIDPTRPTPDWLARRVALAGMRSISLAVDITNYVMLELGQPIHGYDRARLEGPIVVRRATEGEKLTTLDGVTRSLTADDLFICDDRGPIGLAGVMGGAEVELSSSTTDIVIEAAHFSAPLIARTARLQKLPSEASKRFERGVDPTLPARAATRVAQLLVELGGGTLEPGITLVGQAPAAVEVEVPVDLPSRVTGVDITAEAAIHALEANGCGVLRTDATLTVTAPPWRPDLCDPYDIVEEVLRVVGYDQVPSVLPAAPPGRGLTTAQRLRRRAGYVLAGEGLIEVKTFPFAGPADFDRLGLAEDDARRRQVLLENPLSAEEPGMTTTLLVGLLKAAALNVGRGHTDAAITETGRVFIPRSVTAAAPIYGVDRRPTTDEFAVLNEALPDQPWHLGIVLVGHRVQPGWYGHGRAAEWSDAVDVMQAVAESMHVHLDVAAAELRPWHPGRCAELSVSGRAIGYAGELHPQVCSDWDLPPRTCAAEVDLDALITAAPPLGPRPEFSIYPVAKEDLAFIVDDSVSAAELQEALAGSSPLIESVRLFDVYTGQPVPAGQKSLAFAVRLRADDHTLSEDDLKQAREAAVAAAAALGGTLRV